MEHYLIEVKNRIREIQDQLYFSVFDDLLKKGVMVAEAKQHAIALVERELGLKQGTFHPLINMSEADFWEDFNK